MKLHTVKFTIAAIVTTAIIWSVCSLLVFSLPQLTMMYSGDMMHMNTQELMWSLTFAGFIRGLVIWSVFAGVGAWIFVAIYNSLLSGKE